MGTKISASELKNVFISSFKNEKGFKYGEGNPFQVFFQRKRYFVFLKNISPAYYKNLPDISRVQLPFSSHFKKITKSKFAFIILGFDAEYNTFSAWDPSLIKKRLNAKKNVSLFTRSSFQEKLRKNKFKENYISNGDKIIVFSFKSSPEYFHKYMALFIKNNIITPKITPIQNKQTSTDSNKLHKISNKSLVKNLKILLRKNQMLKAVDMCAKYFQKDYPQMDLKDWFHLVETLNSK